MILGLGVDLVDMSRIEHVYNKFGDHFIKKILSSKESAAFTTTKIHFLAGRFAAKEATVKALGTGFANGISFLQIEILNNAAGKPMLILHGIALATAETLGAKNFHVSISHERNNAMAIVILED